MTNTHKIESHLRDRGVTNRTRVIVDTVNNVATFMLYNLSGKLVGYQSYNPNGDKKIHKFKGSDQSLDKTLLYYFTHIIKVGKTKEIAVFGLETYDINSKYLFIVEGIFDAIKLHNQGLPAIALLTCDPVNMKEWLTTLPQEKIAIYDNDGNKDSLKLSRYSDKAYHAPDPYKDLGDMPDREVKDFIKGLKL